MNFTLEKRIYNSSTTVLETSVLVSSIDFLNNYNYKYFKQKLLMNKKILTTEINK